MPNNDLDQAIINSLLSMENPYMSIESLFDWLNKKRHETKVHVKETKFSELKDWNFDKETGNLLHISRKFFSIDGIRVNTNWGPIQSWTQPIINQPEVGLLGILAKIVNGTLYMLMQAKIEPGNINGVQLSPSLQATKSNYKRVHHGKSPDYLNYFLDRSEQRTVILDQLQSEQGARFLKKRNRNIILVPDKAIIEKHNFCWLTLAQIKHLLLSDNIINMDTRTVLSGINIPELDVTSVKTSATNLSEIGFEFLESEFQHDNALHKMEDLISWITQLKSDAELEIQRIGLKNVTEWEISDTEISHKDKKYFSVRALEIEIESREVSKWSQPIVKSEQEGIIAFLIKRINNLLHFLVQAKMEPGNFDLIELAPTVQCLTGNYRAGLSEYEVPYLDYVENPEKYGAVVLHSSLQSEEGGRFYLEQNRNILLLLDENIDLEPNDKYIWMTLGQLKTFIKFNNYLNIQARSLLSIIKYM